MSKWKHSAVHKRPGLVTILIICVMIESGVIFLHPVPLIKSVLLPVTVTVQDNSKQELEGVKVCGISVNNNVIKKLNYSEENRKIVPIKKLVLSIRKGTIETIAEVKVSLGKKDFFVYTKEEFAQKWKRVSGELNEWYVKKDGRIFFEAPMSVRTDSSLSKLSFLSEKLLSIINLNPRLGSVAKEVILLFYIPLLFGTLLFCFLVCVSRREHYRALDMPGMLSISCFESHKRSDIVQLLAVFITTLLVASFFSRLGIDVLHQGFMFQPAVSITEGRMLYRDIYYHYGPLTALLQAFGIVIFGKSLQVIQIQTAVFYALTSVFLWLIWRRFMPAILATISYLIWLSLAPYFANIFLPWSSVYALFFMVLSVYLMILYLESQRHLYLFFTGVSGALCFWCKQPIGITLFGALCFSIISLDIIKKNSLKENNELPRSRAARYQKEFSSNPDAKHRGILLIKKVVLFISGNIIVGAVFMFWLFTNNTVEDWWAQCFTGIVSWAFHTKGGLLTILIKCIGLINALFPCSVWVIFPLVTVLLLFLMLLKGVICRNMSKNVEIVFVLVIVSLMNWANSFPMPDGRHFYWAAAPMIGLFTFFLWWTSKAIIELFKSNNIVLRLCLVFVGFLSFALVGNLAVHNVKSAIGRAQIYDAVLREPKMLRGMRVSDVSQKIALKEFSGTIKRYERNNSKVNMICLSTDNMLFSTFVENNMYFSKSPLGSLSSKFFASKEQYETKLFQYIEVESPLIFTEEECSFPGYYELSHISTTSTSPYDSGRWYLYAPIL